jgi:DNA-binding response OmpR family regulator
MLYSESRMPTVFVISEDWTLRTAVRAELLHAGIEALGMETSDDAAQALARGTAPSAVVVDAAAVNATPASREALTNLARRVPVVVVASRPEISGESGTPLERAAAVLYRPVRVAEIVARVREILAGQAA